MTEKQTIQWIKNNLGEILKNATKDTFYCEEWLGAMVYREVGFLIMRYVSKGFSALQIYPLMKGDYSQRANETKKTYHGYGVLQIDIDSYPAFIKSGNWTSPTHTAKKAVIVLDEKKAYLDKSFPSLKDNQEKYEDAITAAYNCGQRNVGKALSAGLDVDLYTHNHDYSKEVRRFREIYLQL